MGQNNSVPKTRSVGASYTHTSDIPYAFWNQKFCHHIYDSSGPYSESAECGPCHHIQIFKELLYVIFQPHK